MPKKTTEIIIHSGNDYVIGLKGNQKKLSKQVKENIKCSHPLSVHKSIETKRGRQETRVTKVYNNLTGIDQEWIGLKNIVTIKRTGIRNNKPYEQQGYYISSIALKAPEFAQGIRGHWAIENGLHWVKDVVMGEDKSTIYSGNAPANLGMIRNMTINIFRNNGYHSITKAFRGVAHNIKKLYHLLE